MSNEASLSEKIVEEILFEVGAYTEKTPKIQKEQVKHIQNFDAYISERVKKMFEPAISKEEFKDVFPKDFFENLLFHVTDDETLNAFTFKKTPDGKAHICVHRGLLKFCQNEDELMGIIGHEVAHQIHKYIKDPSHRNSKAEEGGADIMALEGMRNAGYHPKYFLTVMERMHAYVEEKNKGKFNETEKGVNEVLDVHPSPLLRKNMLEAWLEKNNETFSQLKETKLDPEVINPFYEMPAVDDFMQIDEAALKDDATAYEAIYTFLKRIKEMETPLYYDENHYILGSSLCQTWDKLLGYYVDHPDKGISQDINLQQGKHVLHLLNTRHKKAVQRLLDTPNISKHFATIWNITEELFPQMEDNFNHEALNLKISLLSTVLSDYFINRIQGRNPVLVLPDKIKEARAYVAELIQNPHLITHEALQDKRFTTVLQSLLKMQESSYMDMANAQFLLKPEFKIEKGDKLPYYELIKSTIPADDKVFLSQLSNDQYDDPVRILMTTLGQYDSNAFLVTHSALPYSCPNLLTPDKNIFMPRYFNHGNPMSVMRETSNNSWFVDWQNGYYSETYHYDLKSGQVKEISVNCTPFYGYLGRKYESTSLFDRDHDVRFAREQMLDKNYEKHFENYFHKHYTKYHYELKKRFSELKNLPANSDTFNELLNLKACLLTDGSRDSITIPNDPNNPDSIVQNISYPNVSKYHPDSEITRLYAQHSPEIVKDNEHLFEFLTKIESVNQVLDTYMRFTEAALHDKQLFQRMMRDHYYIYFISFMLPKGQTKPKILTGEKVNGAFYEERLEDYIIRRYLPDLYQLYNQEPFLSNLPAEYLPQVLIGNYEKTIPILLKKAPDLVQRFFPYYKPAKSAQDIVNMINDYKNFEKSLKTAEPIVSYAQMRMFKEIIQVEIKNYAERGKTDLPVEALMFLSQDRALAQWDIIGLNKKFVSPIKEGDIGKIQSYVETISDIRNWSDDTFKNMDILQKNTYVRDETGDYALSDMMPQSIIEDYQKKLCAASSFEEKMKIMEIAFPEYQQVLSDEIINKILSPKAVPSVWENTPEENIAIYLHLVERNKALTDDTPLKKDVLDHVVAQIEEIKDPESREWCARILLSKSAKVSFPSIQKRLRSCWVNTVGEIMGKPDDMSEQYLENLAPYIESLKSEEMPERTTYQSAMSLEMRTELSKMLQEKLVSQYNLSMQLNIETPFKEILADPRKNAQTGLGLEAILKLPQLDVEVAQEFSSFLLGARSRKDAEKLNALIHEKIPDYIDDFCRGATPDKLLYLHDYFWDKSHEIRTLIFDSVLDSTFKKQDPQLKQDYIFKKLLPPDMPAREQFLNALKNYAEAVENNEEYRTEFLLIGCLVVQQKEPNEEMNIGKVIKTFLESQGPAGVKIGQFLSVQQDVPEEVRQELLQLTNHASTHSRAEVFKLIEEYHPGIIEEIKKNGLGKLLGAASHYLTFNMNENEVLSVSRFQSELKAESVYKRLEKALEKTIADQPENVHLLHIVQDAVEQAHRMNHTELNSNVGYIQMRLARRLYDNVSMDIDGYRIHFKTMNWTRQPAPLRTYVKDGQVYWSQNYKIMEKAPGDNYTDIPDGPEKTALAKANFLLNLRAILMGGVFDDDRHQGQLKVEKLPDGKFSVGLFDTGSMSIKAPSTAERKLLGHVFHKTLRGLLALRQSDSAKSLKQIYPKTATEGAENIERLMNTDDQLVSCFHAAINEIRDETTGKTPPYISKAERALANLQHFACDIPAEELTPLIFQLMQQKGTIHPDILAGMGEKDAVLDQQIIQNLLPEGKISSFVINAPQKETSPTQATELVVQPTSKSPLITSIQNLIGASSQLSGKEKSEYLLTIGALISTPKDEFVLDGMNKRIAQIKNPAVRTLLAQNLCEVAKGFISEIRSGKSTEEISTSIVSYLSNNKIPGQIIKGINSNKSLMDSILLRMAFLNNNKLVLGKKRVQTTLTEHVSKFIENWKGMENKIQSFLETNAQIHIAELPNEKINDRKLPTYKLKEDGKMSMATFKNAKEAYGRK